MIIVLIFCNLIKNENIGLKTEIIVTMLQLYENICQNINAILCNINEQGYNKVAKEGRKEKITKKQKDERQNNKMFAIIYCLSLNGRYKMYQRQKGLIMRRESVL